MVLEYMKQILVHVRSAYQDKFVHISVDTLCKTWLLGMLHMMPISQVGTGQMRIFPSLHTSMKKVLQNFKFHILPIDTILNRLGLLYKRASAP
jgi:hypothetical protein